MSRLFTPENLPRDKRRGIAFALAGAAARSVAAVGLLSALLLAAARLGGGEIALALTLAGAEEGETALACSGRG